jgi:hypothetical protein
MQNPNDWFAHRSRRPRGGGNLYKGLFQRQKWIPAFAGTTLRSGGERAQMPHGKSIWVINFRDDWREGVQTGFV